MKSFSFGEIFQALNSSISETIKGNQILSLQITRITSETNSYKLLKYIHAHYKKVSNSVSLCCEFKLPEIHFLLKAPNFCIFMLFVNTKHSSIVLFRSNVLLNNLTCSGTQSVYTCSVKKSISFICHWHMHWKSVPKHVRQVKISDYLLLL